MNEVQRGASCAGAAGETELVATPQAPSTREASSELPRGSSEFPAELDGREI